MSRVLGACKKIRMPKIEDKELRNQIIKDHLILLGKNKKYEQELENLRTVHLGAYDKQIEKLQELQNQLQTETDRAKQAEIVREINAMTEVRDAISPLNKAQDELGKKEVKGITLIDAVKFTEELQKQDYDCGIVEDIFPLLSYDVEEEKPKKK